MKRLFILLLVLSVSHMSFAQNHEMEAKADSLFNNFAEEEALELYQQILEEDPYNYTALWRTSLLYSRVGNLFDDEDRKKEYFQRGIELAEQALEADSTDVESNFVMSVAMGRQALIAGARDRVAAAREIKKYADRALEIDPEHPGVHHVLGRWHHRMANLSFGERTAAKILYGGIPDGSSNEKAIEHLQKAIDLNADFVLYHRDLALVYEEVGEEKEAVRSCEEALEVETRGAEDDDYKESCRDLIKKLS